MSLFQFTPIIGVDYRQPWCGLHLNVSREFHRPFSKHVRMLKNHLISTARPTSKKWYYADFLK